MQIIARQRHNEMNQQAESISAREIYIDGDVNVENGDFVAGDKHTHEHITKEAELRVVENWIQRFLRNANEYLAARIFHEKNINTYYGRVLNALSQLKVIGKDTPLELEKIYITLRISQYRSRDFVPDDIGDEAYERIPTNLAELHSKSFTVDHALNLGRHLVILGDPGSGKSTLLRHLTRRLCKKDTELIKFSNVLNHKGKDHFILPIFATLNDFVPSSKSLIQHLETSVEEKGFPYPGQYIRESLARGECFILLDGLDEVVDDTTQEQVVQQINQMVEQYGEHNYFLVTSRMAGFRDRLSESFIKLEIVEFDKRDIETFIFNWYKETPERGEDLLYRLEHNQKMIALASNPLLLSIIAFVYEQGWKLPDRRVELYDECAEILFKKWEARKNHPRSSLFKEQWRLVVEDLAYKFFMQDPPQIIFSKEDLLGVLSEILPAHGIESKAASNFLNEIMEQTGILRQKSRSTYDFIHLTLQEYFVASALEKRNEVDLAVGKGIVPQWHEVIRLLTGIVQDPTKLIIQIFDAGINDPQYLVLGASCFSDMERIDENLKTYIFSLLLSILISNENIIQINGIDDVLKHLSIHEIKTLQKLAEKHTDDPEMLLRVINIFGLMGSPEPIPQLLHLLDHRDTRIVEMSAVALAKIGDLSVGPLIQALDNSNPFARRCIVESLGEIGNLEAIEPLFEIVEKEDDLDVKIKIIQVLGKIGDPPCSRELVKYLVDPRPKLRSITALALGQIGNPDITLDLVDTLRDVDSRVVNSAGIALNQLGYFAVSNIMNSFSHTTNPGTQIEPIILALGYTGSRDAIPLLRNVLQSKDYYTRLLAARAFGLHREATEEDLEDGLTNSDPKIRATTALALGYMGKVKARNLLYQRVRDVSPLVAISAALANNILVKQSGAIRTGNIGYKLSDFSDCYGLIPEKEGVYFLLDLLRSPDRNVRDHARRALVSYAGYLNKLNVIELHKDNIQAVRISGSLHKARLPQEMKDIYDYLVKMMNDPNEDVRNSAAMSLAQLDRSEKYNGLKFLQKSILGMNFGSWDRYRVRDAAVFGLMSRREITLKFLLNTLLSKNTDPRIVEFLALALGNWGETSAAMPLLSLLDNYYDYYDSVQVAALKSLGRIANVNTLPGLIGLGKRKLIPRVRITWIDALSNFNDDRIPPLLAKFTRDSDKLVADTAKKTLEKIQKRMH